ncbi:MAG TPA: hypothetical protein ENO00_13550 [Deltaproteobacteria bacterium]|nr:hypothetical protein [Deltaproteobacteria bacterium]
MNYTARNSVASSSFMSVKIYFMNMQEKIEKKRVGRLVSVIGWFDETSHLYPGWFLIKRLEIALPSMKWSRRKEGAT